MRRVYGNAMRRCTPISQSNATYVVLENDLCKTFRIPEKLVDVVVADDLVMILLPSNELVVNDFVALVPHKAIQRLDDRLKVKTLRDGIDAVLALGTTVVVVRTLEDEAQTFRNEPHLRSLAPKQQIERDLTHPVILAHVVHRLPPPVQRAVQLAFNGLVTLGLALLGT